MSRIILDGRYMKTKKQAHIYLKEKLQMPEYYGENLDALWDVLSTYSKIIEIKFINKFKVIEYLNDYGKALIEVFEDAEDENLNIELQLVE